MKTILFAASKGGVGKTTLCAVLSAYAGANTKKNVAMIDLDPQGGLTSWWNSRTADYPHLIETTLQAWQRPFRQQMQQATPTSSSTRRQHT